MSSLIEAELTLLSRSCEFIAASYDHGDKYTTAKPFKGCFEVMPTGFSLDFSRRYLNSIESHLGALASLPSVFQNLRNGFPLVCFDILS